MFAFLKMSTKSSLFNNMIWLILRITLEKIPARFARRLSFPFLAGTPDTRYAKREGSSAPKSTSPHSPLVFGPDTPLYWFVPQVFTRPFCLKFTNSVVCKINLSLWQNPFFFPFNFQGTYFLYNFLPSILEHHHAKKNRLASLAAGPCTFRLLWKICPLWSIWLYFWKIFGSLRSPLVTRIPFGTTYTKGHLGFS